jgi:hypothetical protein
LLRACVRASEGVPSVGQDNSAIENAEPASAFSMAEPGNAQTVTYPVLYRFSQSLLIQVQFAFWYLLPSSLIYYFYGQISVCPFVEVVKPRSQLCVCRRSETQGNPVSVYRGPETQVLRARHGRIVSDRHGYPLVYIRKKMDTFAKDLALENCHTDSKNLIYNFACCMCASVRGRSDPLTVSAMSILQPPKNEPQRPILLRICFFFFIFFLLDLFFRKNLRLRIRFFFYLFFLIKKKKWAEKSKATYLLLF